jgi:amidase
MSTDIALHRMTARDIAAGLKKKAFSATELCEASIARIETLDTNINAVIVRDFDRARADARAADLAIGRGEFKPLTGVPMTVKESFDLRGYPDHGGL